MTEYKLYCIGSDGRILRREDCYAVDDLAALDRAGKLCGTYEIEIWASTRLVARVAKDGSASMHAQRASAPQDAASASPVWLPDNAAPKGVQNGRVAANADPTTSKGHQTLYNRLAAC